MPRQSITFTDHNDAWLQQQAGSGEYVSKSDVVNHLIRQARCEEVEIERIRALLIEGEQTGFSTRSKDEIRADALARLRTDGAL